jgi:hypothetical protein
MNKILDALRTPSAMLVALLLALVAQLEHTAQVFMQVVHASGDGAQVHAYAFAIAVETAVLLFVLHGHKRISYGFAIATFATNLSYYAMHGVDLTSIAGAPAWLMAGLLPAAIVGYSHTIADTPNTTATTTPAKPATRRRWQFWRKPTEPATTHATSNTTTPTPVATPSESGGHSEAVSATSAPAEQTGATSGQPEGADVPTHDTRTQALQLRDEGYTAAEIARMTGAKYSTVQSWLRRATVQTNGGAHL